MSSASMLQFLAKKRQILSVVFVIFLFFNGSFAQENTDSKDPVQIFNQGQDAHEKGDFQTALKFYDDALKIIPEFPEAEYQRGNIFLSLNKPNEALK